MKKWITITLTFCMIFALAACGTRNNTPEDTTEPLATVPEDETVPESESETKEQADEPESAEDTKEETEPESPAETSEPSGSNQVSIKVYHPDSDAMYFELADADIAELTGDAVLAAVLKQINFPETIKVNNFSQSGKNLTLDLPTEFVSFLRANSGSSVEYLYVGSVVNTFLDAFDAETITITINGGTFETGHSEYNGALYKYE